MNNSFHSHVDPSSESQAALWAARLDGGPLAPSDQEKLQAWLAGRPDRRTLLSEFCQHSADLERMLPALVASGAVDRPEPTSSRRARWTSLKIAAGITLVAGAAAAIFFFASPHGDTQVVNIATPVAERTTLTLVDGSRTELDAQSNLQVEIGPKERRLRLAHGSAYFSVSKDENRPFIVETPAGLIRVTGTVFAVRTEEAANFEVLVVEGSVQVHPRETDQGRPAAPVVLGAGQHLSAGLSGISIRSLEHKAIEDALAWRHGRVVFEGVPLREALSHFARYHGRGITAAGDAADLRIGGRFSLDDLDGFLSSLETILPVRVSRGLSGTTQVRLADTDNPIHLDAPADKW